ncbi:MAG TPA: hypothetical protein EYG85_05580 [Crocinitomix sp.]|nr:hypothetical protein [Crocinitomix sp.]
MYKLIFFLILAFGINYNSFSITVGSDDSLRIAIFPKSVGNKKWKILVGLDARRSFFQTQKVKINGIRLGVQYKGVHRFGFGFYSLSKKIEFKNFVVDKADAQNPTSVLVDVNYNSLFYERVFLKTKKWEISFPLHLGKGLFKRQYLNNLGNYKQWDKKSFSVFNVGFQVKYYIFTWFAPRISFGYRHTYKTLPEIQEAFNKPYYAFGLSISLGELFRSIFN